MEAGSWVARRGSCKLPWVERATAALASMASHAGLHPLAPYLVKFCVDEVAASLPSTHALHVLLRLVDALLRNDDIGLEPYVHQLLPALITCLVARNIGGV